MYSIYDTLVGYVDPDDNENEDACALAYYVTEKFNEQYPTVEVQQ